MDETKYILKAEKKITKKKNKKTPVSYSENITDSRRNGKNGSEFKRLNLKIPENFLELDSLETIYFESTINP